LTNFAGTGATATFTNASTANGQRFFRVQTQ